MLYYFGIITRKSFWELLKNELSGMDTKKPIKWGRMSKREGVKKKRGMENFWKKKLSKKLIYIHKSRDTLASKKSKDSDPKEDILGNFTKVNFIFFCTLSCCKKSLKQILGHNSDKIVQLAQKRMFFGNFTSVIYINLFAVCHAPKFEKKIFSVNLER